MPSTLSGLSASATFNGNYHDVQGSQDNRHSRTIGTINSTFTTIGGDQIDSRSYTIHIHTSPSRTSLPHLIQSVANASNLAGASDGLPVQIQSHHQQAMVASDSAFALIISIVQLLRVNHTDPSDSDGTFRDIERALKLLYDTISATRVALQLFEFTPLGRNFSTTIKLTVLDCCENLRKMLDQLENYRNGLNYTTLWSSILWSGHEFDELYAINNKLSETQVELKKFLAAINSYVH